jgi:hypothetical protein
MEFHNPMRSMNHKHTIPIVPIVGNSIFLAQTEQGENICNTILVDVNLSVVKFSNLHGGHCAFVAMDFYRQLSRANILDMLKI